MFKELPTGALTRQLARVNLIAGTPSTAFRIDSQRTRRIELLLVHGLHHKPLAGLRRFWRYNLPTLRFHNDDVDFVCTRFTVGSKEEIPKIVTRINLHDANGKTTPVDCRNKSNVEILDLVVKATGAVPVPESEIPVFKFKEEEL